MPGLRGVVVGRGLCGGAGCAPGVRPSRAPSPGSDGTSRPCVPLRALRSCDAVVVPCGGEGSGAVWASSFGLCGVAASCAVPAGASPFGGPVGAVRGACVAGDAGVDEPPRCGSSAGGGRAYRDACGGRGAREASGRDRASGRGPHALASCDEHAAACVLSCDGEAGRGARGRVGDSGARPLAMLLADGGCGARALQCAPPSGAAGRGRSRQGGVGGARSAPSAPGMACGAGGAGAGDCGSGAIAGALRADLGHAACRGDEVP